MAYHLMSYYIVFLLIVIALYQFMPQKYRKFIMLAANYTFFYMISGLLIIYLLVATLFTFYIGKTIEKKKNKKAIVSVGVWACIIVIFILKYTNFVMGNVFGIIGKEFTAIHFLVPIGLSFYSLQMISYMVDVYRGTLKAEHNLLKMALWLSFFPHIMEGPIVTYTETADALYEGEKITFNNLKFGYQRILWGLFKKMVIADRLFGGVHYVFDMSSQSYSGAVILYGAICYTMQLYMEFSGCMDIVIGSAQIFGITLPENFNQPFFARNASEFWRRWHISLGRFFKNYIFYTVSMAKPVKKFAKLCKKKIGKGFSKYVAPIAALFCVWSCNGLWHGAEWTFIFYGMYYFVIILYETITEETVIKITSKLHINREHFIYRLFQGVKLFVIVIIGELIFRSTSLSEGLAMAKKIFTDFNPKAFLDCIGHCGISKYDCMLLGITIPVMLIVGILREKGINIRERIDKWFLPFRWIFWYGLIAAIIVLGAYGEGYYMVDLIYAAY